MEDAGELDPDKAAADDDDPVWQVRKKKCLIGSDGILGARNLGHYRPATRGDQYVLCSVLPLADEHGVRIEDNGVVVDNGDTGIFEYSAVDPVQPLDFGILIGYQLCPVHAPLSDAPAKAGRILEVLVEMSSVDQKLFGNAADVDTGAAQVTLLGNGNFRSIGSR